MTQSGIPIVNLIPLERIQRRQQSQWIARWTACVLVTSVVVGIPGLYIGGSAALTDSGMSDQIHDANVELTKHQQAIPILRDRLGMLNAELEVLDLVHNRIEWRDVFSILVDSAGNDVRFRSLSAVGGGIEGESPIEISIEGLAQSQSVARRYVVDLESSNVFDAVKLTETNREPIGGLELIRFRIMITVESVVPKDKEGEDAG